MKWLAALGAFLAAAAYAAPPLTFAHDIAPIIYQNCAGCHRPGESGPFPLLRYEDVKQHARQIADVTGRRSMPPWAPEAGYGDFLGERRLTDTQIRLIADWVSQGAPEGNASDTPPLPKFTEGWQLGPPDMILEAQNAYNLPASGPDVYWNFVIPATVGAAALCSRRRDPAGRPAQRASREPVRGSHALGAPPGDCPGPRFSRKGGRDRSPSVGTR